MKRRISQTNIQVKKDMYAALLQLMANKPFSSISVSDITTEAGVSRMAFYRNYKTIEDILTEHLSEVVEEYRKEEIEKTGTGNEEIFYEKKYIIHCFRFFYMYHEFIDALIVAGMGDLFLSKITEYLIKKWGDKEKKTREEILKISAFAGSIYNMYREWSKDCFHEDPENIAEILLDLKQ